MQPTRARAPTAVFIWYLTLVTAAITWLVDCVESTAARSTCAAVDKELYTRTTNAYNGGTVCTGSSAKCVEGDFVDVPLNDDGAYNNRGAPGSIYKAVIHTGSRHGGLVASTNVVAVFRRTIIILHSYVESPIMRDSHPSRFCGSLGTKSSPDQN